MKIVFFMSRPGHVRNYEETLRIVAARGHTIHLAFSSMRPKRNEPPDLPQAEALVAGCSGITFGQAPTRERDGWDRVAATVRHVGDFARFLHPRYREAELLRARAASRLVRGAGAKGPGVMASCRRAAVGLFCRVHSARLSEALTGACRIAERAVRPSTQIKAYLEAERAELVLVTPCVEIGSSQAEYVKAARELGIPTGLCVASWDNLTNKGVLRVEPDRVFVWNDVQRREAVELHGVPYDRVVLTGAPRFDEWFRRVPMRSAEAFKEAVGLHPSEPYLLYLCSSPFIAPSEVPFVERWLRALRSCGNPTLEAMGVLVRPHPQNAAQWQGVQFDDSNAVVWPREGAQVTDADSKADFYDSIAHAAAVVGVNTSALIEASILERSVFTVLAPEFAGTQQGTLHYHYLREENGGFLHEAATLPDHLAQLESALGGGTCDQERARRFVEFFVRPLGRDIAASDALATGIERTREVSVPREQPAFSVSLARVLLAPVAAWARWRESRRHRGPLRRRLAAVLARSSAARRFARWLVEGLALPEPARETAQAMAARVDRQAFDLADRHARRFFASAPDRVVVGPWVGDASTEVLYWIPYIRWLAEHHGVPPERLVAISDRGVPAWYEGLAGVCVDGSRHPGIPSSIFDDVVLGFVSGLVQPGEVLRRSRYARLPAPAVPLGDRLPESYVVIASSDDAVDGRVGADGAPEEEALVARLESRIPTVRVHARLADIEFEDRSLLGRRETDSATATLSAVVAGAQTVIGPPDGLAVALAVCHGIRTIGMQVPSHGHDWQRIDLLIRISHAVGSSFSILDPAHLKLVPARANSTLRASNGVHSREQASEGLSLKSGLPPDRDQISGTTIQSGG